jgi:hypothetical protein
MFAQELHCKRCRWPKSTKSNSRGRITNELVSDKQVSVTSNEEVDRSGWKNLALAAEERPKHCRVLELLAPDKPSAGSAPRSKAFPFGKVHGADARYCFWWNENTVHTSSVSDSAKVSRKL